jgi:hypothetical protein
MMPLVKKIGGRAKQQGYQTGRNDDPIELIFDG